MSDGAARYERLRLWVLEGGGGEGAELGLAVLVNRGVASWCAFACCASHASSEVAIDLPAGRDQAAPTRLIHGLAQLVIALRRQSA